MFSPSMPTGETLPKPQVAAEKQPPLHSGYPTRHLPAPAAHTVQV